MDDSLRLVSASICIILSVLTLAVNGPTVANILMRPTLRTTLNNLTCALLTINFTFGSIHFLLNALKITNSTLILSGRHLCTGLVIVPQFFRIISLYILMGSLFLRSLFVKHAKYISLVSKRNHLVISDFGLPIWITIFTFVSLNILFMVLHSNVPDNFPNVRLCRGCAEAFRNNMDKDLYLQTILTTSSGSIILATFVVSVHLRLHDYLRRYHQRSLNNFRRNVTTAKQTILACYIKLGFALVNCSLLHLQVRREGLVSTGLTEMLEMLAMAVECVLVPSFWLQETRNNFPELTSTNNSILRNVFFGGNTVGISVIPLQELPMNNNERPLSPRRPTDLRMQQEFRHRVPSLQQPLRVDDLPPIII